jgi:DNA processing protein
MLPSTAILALLDLRGVGRKTVARLLRVPHPDPSGAGGLLDWIKAAHGAGVRITPPSLSEVEFALDGAERLVDACQDVGVTVLLAGDEWVPDRLRGIADPPVALFVRGDLTALAAPSTVAIIGTRDPTPFGRSAAERLAQLFAESGFVIVSGLAEGCDTHAHLGCLKGGGKTIAVLAHGLDRVYPRKNAELADRIASEGGCLVSEYPLGTAPQRSYFVERDRLQSGLAQAVVVVETDVTGGTMHTVGFCLEQRRVLACLSHPAKMLGSPQTRGNQKMIADGKARPLATAADIAVLKDELLRAGGRAPAAEPPVTQASPPAETPAKAEPAVGKEAGIPPISQQPSERGQDAAVAGGQPTESAATPPASAEVKQPPASLRQEDFLDALGVPRTPPVETDGAARTKGRRRKIAPGAGAKPRRRGRKPRDAQRGAT